VGRDACRSERHRDRGVGRKGDFANHQVRRVLLDAGNMDGLVRLVLGHSVVGAWADQGVDHWGDRQKAKVLGCQWASGHGFLWGAGHDSQWAKDVAAGCRFEQKRQQQGEQLRAGRGVVGRARRGAGWAKRQEHLAQLDAKADRAVLLGPALVPKVFA